jgi:hypothetical protein
MQKFKLSNAYEKKPRKLRWIYCTLWTNPTDREEEKEDVKRRIWGAARACLGGGRRGEQSTAKPKSHSRSEKGARMAGGMAAREDQPKH